MLIETILAAFIVLLLVVVGMAVGVILSNRRIAGSCGGLAAIDGVDRCGVCGRDMGEVSQGDCGKQG